MVITGKRVWRVWRVKDKRMSLNDNKKDRWVSEGLLDDEVPKFSSCKKGGGILSSLTCLAFQYFLRGRNSPFQVYNSWNTDTLVVFSQESEIVHQLRFSLTHTFFQVQDRLLWDRFLTGNQVMSLPLKQVFSYSLKTTTKRKPEAAEMIAWESEEEKNSSRIEKQYIHTDDLVCKTVEGEGNLQSLGWCCSSFRSLSLHETTT